MSLLNEAAPGDKQLERYVLGLLPEEAAERIDELSIVDDDVANRLQMVENALVDAYVRGELAGETLEQFELVYLASERRREKVQFARTLLGSPVHRPVRRRSNTGWMLAVAAALILLAGGVLVYRDAQLRTELRDAQQASAALSDRARTPEQQLSDARSPRVEAVKTPDAAPPALPPIALVLLPQMRATGPITTLAIPQGIDRVAFLKIDAEGHDFEALESLDLARIAPRIIMLEFGTNFAGQTLDTLNGLLARMKAQGYRSVICAYDDDSNLKRGVWSYRLKRVLVDAPCPQTGGDWFGNILFFRAGDTAFLLTLHALLDSARPPANDRPPLVRQHAPQWGRVCRCSAARGRSAGSGSD